MITIYDRKGFSVLLAVPGDSLRQADLRQAPLANANMVEYDLSHADLRGATLTGSDLRLARLCHADLRGADLTDADLSGADLSHAHLDAAVLTDARLTDALLPAGGDALPAATRKLKTIAIKDER